MRNLLDVRKDSVKKVIFIIIIIIIVNTDVTGNHGLNVYKICNNASNIYRHSRWKPYIFDTLRKDSNKQDHRAKETIGL